MSPHVKAPEITRGRILQVAMEEIHMHGFQGVSINKIVEKAGVTKGALFHHFKGKNELGYAVVDEVISKEIYEYWIKPMSNSVDPVKDLKKILLEAKKEFLENPEMLKKGCPLSNLAHEMSPLDSNFREKIEHQFSRWRGVLQKGFETGKTAGTVKESIDSEVAAVFVVSALEGLISTCKSSHDMELAGKVMKGLFAYLDSLKN